MAQQRAPKTTEQQFYTIYARHKADLGEPPDETDDVASTLARIGIPPGTYTHRAVYNTEQLNPKFGKFWMFLVGIRAEWDWDSGLEPPWWCSRHPDRNGEEITVQYILLRMRSPTSALALEFYYPPAVPTGLTMRGLDQPHTQKDLLALYRARGNLGAFAKSLLGRPDDTKHYRAGDDDVFAKDVERAARACIEGGDPVNNSTVSNRMGCDRGTLAGYFGDFPSVRLKSIETKIQAETLLPAKPRSLRVTRKKRPCTV